jgi:hypothetical protein
MKNKTYLLLLAVSLTAAQASAQVIVDNDFSIANASPWGWTKGGVTVVNDTTNAFGGGTSNGIMQATDTDGRDDYLTTAALTPVTLAVGESMIFTGKFRVTDAANVRDGYGRFGMAFATEGSMWGGADAFNVRFNAGADLNPGTPGDQGAELFYSNEIQVVNSTTTGIASANDYAANMTDAVMDLEFSLTRDDLTNSTLTFKLDGATVVSGSYAGALPTFSRFYFRTDQPDAVTGTSFQFDDMKIQVIPEPSSFVLMVAGLAAMAAFASRRSRRQN